MRTLEKSDSPLLEGYQIFHSFIRPHMALKGKIPAEAAGVDVSGKNKWLTLIQNANKTSGTQDDAEQQRIYSYIRV